MARKLTDSEELAFSSNRPFTDLLAGEDEYFSRYFKDVMCRSLAEPAASIDLSDQTSWKKKGPLDDWF